MQRLDDFIGGVAGERESRGRGVYFHCPPQRLLGARGHAVRLIQDDQFLSALGEGHFLLSEAFDPIADHIDAAFVAGIELQHGFLVGVTEKLAGETENGGCLADAWHAGYDDVGHVTIFGDDLESLDCLCVADYVVEVDWSVFLNPVEWSLSRAATRGGEVYTMAYRMWHRLFH